MIHKAYSCGKKWRTSRLSCFSYTKPFSGEIDVKTVICSNFTPLYQKNYCRYRKNEKHRLCGHESWIKWLIKHTAVAKSDKLVGFPVLRIQNLNKFDEIRKIRKIIATFPPLAQKLSRLQEKQKALTICDSIL